jgi:type I restriction enzyme, S subunit
MAIKKSDLYSSLWASCDELRGGIDAELTVPEQRRDKTRLLKRGMMQELLTGRTRLV